MTSPLSKADLANVRKAIYALSEAETEISKAEAAGIDVEEAKLRQAHYKESLMKILNVYGGSEKQQ